MARNYPEDLDRELEIVNERAGPTGPSEIIRLGDEAAAVGVLSEAVLGLWEVVNNLTRLRPTRRLRYRVTVFGVEWARRSMLRPDGPLASPEDLAIPTCCRTGPEILDLIREHHGRWKTNQEARS